jgi:DNA-binding transcriptional MerR regulator
MRGSTTQKVADLVGVSKRQLLRWLYDGKIAEPKRERIGATEIRVWSATDIRRARQFKERSSVTRISRMEA